MYRKLHYTCHLISPQTFEEMVNQFLAQFTCIYTPIRMVFFTAVSSNSQYQEYLALLTQKVTEKFGAETPVISLVAQKTLDNVGLAIEVHEMEILATESLHYHQWHGTPYITLQDDSVKRLYLGGIISKELDNTIIAQSEEVFDTIKAIMEIEAMPIHSIVRQWNYIERITECDRDRQNYQAFNDARSIFYNQAEWEHGFPAATGIGTQWGGVMVDLNATLACTDQTTIIPIDNPLQVAAHAYSQVLLLGEPDERLTEKTTPKFERAKGVTQCGNGVLYVSGTAAIRGELSLEEVGIEEQTRITIENINILTGEHPLSLIRVYLKNIEDLEGAQSVIAQLYPSIPAIYLQADVCREELLIEIEGISQIIYS